MLDFLKTIFGDNITAVPYDCPEKMPYYIRDNYKLQRLSWKNNECVLLSPSSSSWRLPTLKKHLKNLQEICQEPCALSLENLTSMQRKNLLENSVPFISASQQVYLPFWGCAFMEKFKSDTPIPDKMAPGTQLVFLYLYYLKEAEDINLTKISKELQLSKATCTRAINDLTASGLLVQKIEGTNKWITPAFEKPEFLKKGYARLRSPVERLVYVRDLPDNLLCIQSGVKALSVITMVGAKEQDAGLAVSKKTCPSISPDNLISKQEFEDFGGTVLEVWSYDPSLLSKNGRVDDISLLLSLDSEPDERIQMGLDEIREKHELPVKQDE